MQRLQYFIGSKAFYRKLFRIAVPIMIQNGITNFVNMLDNIMVGQIGTDQMSGVAIVNQLVFVFNLAVFGGLAGIGIFTAQYFGKGDEEGVRYTFRAKIIMALLILAFSFLILGAGSTQFIRLYLHEDASGGSAVLTMQYAKQYLHVMYLSFLPFALCTVYSDTLRETGEAALPMRAGLLAVAVNLAGNYILIFGHFGAPALGVAGAAAATAISRVVELFYVAFRTHSCPELYPFIKGVYRHFRIPSALLGKFFVKALPMLANEVFWTLGQTALLQCYSVRGLMVVAGFNISSTLANVMNVSFIAMGSAIAIIIGQELGARHLENIRQEATQLTFAAVSLCVVFAAVMFALAGVFPQLYNTSSEVKSLAASLIRVCALWMPMYGCETAFYFIIRSGGKVLITFFFDSAFCWFCSVPAAFILAHFTAVPIVQMYLYVQLFGAIKIVCGYILVRKGIWIQNLT